MLQHVMSKAGVPFIDNTVDIGIRIETREERYTIVKDYYDPKFNFPGRVRTFCTNSGAAYVVKDGKVSFRYVRVGKSFDNGMIAVLSGLDAGEQVAVNPIRAGVVLKQQRQGKAQGAK